MRKREKDDNGFKVSLASVECKSFYNYLKEEAEVPSPETLQVARSQTIFVYGEDELEVEVGLLYGGREETYSEIRVMTRFQIVNPQKVIKVDRNTRQVLFDESLLRIVLPVALDTARGYCSARLEGSPLAAFPFPIIRTDDLIKTCRIMLCDK